MGNVARNLLLPLGVLLAALPPVAARDELPANTWVRLRHDDSGARRGCAVRYAPAAKAFLLWGFPDADPEFLQENPTLPLAEHDVIAFDLARKRWSDHAPADWKPPEGKRPVSFYVPRTYHGLTSGSERSLFRAPEGFPREAARPDLNITFDQVVYHPPSRSLVYFVGGLTAAYHVEQRRWSDLAPGHAPPPVLGGSLAYDTLHNELVLFGGGNVAEKGPGGRLVGYTGTWTYSFADKDWRPLAPGEQPPPRTSSPMVCDPLNRVLVLFGGDGQSHYLADTWLYDLKTRSWRASRAPGGPPPRAGHFTAYDPNTARVLVGGGYNRDDLTDLWAYDAGRDRWQRLAGKVPTGAYVTADVDPERRMLLLVSNTRAPGHSRNCDVLYAARTTYAYRIDEKTIVQPDAPVAQVPMPTRPKGQSGRDFTADPARQKARADLLRNLPVNRWVPLSDPARRAPARSWGSATFDSDRGRILIWGGGHCGYGGSDVDAYDVAAHNWVSSVESPEYPHRLWASGVRLAGVTFGGNPWSEHGRRVYAYDPTSRKVISVRPILLTTGYEPEGLRDYPGRPRARVDAKVKPPTAYNKYVTWTFDPDTGTWEVVGPAPAGVDTLVTTRHGVMGIDVDWPTRLNDAGHLLPWDAGQPAKDNGTYRFDAEKKSWRRLGEAQPSPQNLYEMTSLAYDSRRDRVLLHGGGKERNELWAFDLKSNRWQNLKPRVVGDGAAPRCNREAVYLPGQDVLLTYGPAPGKEGRPALWAYVGSDNVWQRVALERPAGVSAQSAAGQNRALVYDAARDVVFLVPGTHDRGDSLVFALRYRHEGKAK